MRSERHGQVRILGTDCTGKSRLCEAIAQLSPNFVQFASTPPYVYDWLRTHRIGRSSAITFDQLETREQIFLAANRVEMQAIGEVTRDRPVVAVRGRADTIITHGILQGRKLLRDLNRLFPAPYMRPDALVVLTADIQDIEQRLDARGEAKTGANSLAFHEACQEAYLNIGNLASRRFPVYVYSTSNPANTPESIADDLLGRTAA